ncbi:hypothetical protein CRENPOLYSF2_370054 [Crenothrix polyspora]|uniref:Uncharacterized protein n=1 Tax=Crenothrix polyspora TaxID=360316 RepID=A0A1R4HCK8_9GAMM|nr:hypothetical protein CRENPOLYSF2_370054 [Crenothrix polyspora]
MFVENYSPKAEISGEFRVVSALPERHKAINKSLRSNPVNTL